MGLSPSKNKSYRVHNHQYAFYVHMLVAGMIAYVASKMVDVEVVSCSNASAISKRKRCIQSHVYF